MTPRAYATPSTIARTLGHFSRMPLVALIVCTVVPYPAQAFQPAQPRSFEGEPVQASHLAALGFGVSANGPGGPLGFVSIMAAGEQPPLAAWVLRGLMTTPFERARLGAATLFTVLTGPMAPMTTVCMLGAGEHFDCWRLMDTDRVSRLTDSELSVVEDGTAFASTLAESPVYWHTIYRAAQTSVAAFREEARVYWRALSLTKKPAQFRGDVFYLEGTLRAITQLDVTRIALPAFVAPPYYAELTNRYGDVFLIHFTELPAGFRLTKGLVVRASFAGYFFKLSGVRNGPPVPMFIGRTFQPILLPEDHVPEAAASLLLAYPAGPAESTAPLAAGALLRTGEALDYWRFFARGQEPALRRDLLLAVRDRGFFPNAEEDDLQQIQAYFDFLAVASRTPPEVYAREAEANKAVTYAQMVTNPTEYRGQPIPLHGTLFCLKQHPAPKSLQALGIPHLYEAWVFDKTNGKSNTYCIVLTEPPDGVEPAREMSRQVLDLKPYFFKKGDFEGDKDNKRHLALLFVGRTMKVAPIARNVEYGDTLLVSGVAFLLISGVAVFAFALWFRRSDRKAQQRLRAARAGNFVPPPPDAVPMAMPVGLVPQPKADEPPQS